MDEYGQRRQYGENTLSDYQRRSHAPLDSSTSQCGLLKGLLSARDYQGQQQQQQQQLRLSGPAPTLESNCSSSSRYHSYHLSMSPCCIKMSYDVPHADTQSSALGVLPCFPSISPRDNSIVSTPLLLILIDGSLFYFGEDLVSETISLEHIDSSLSTIAYGQDIPSSSYYITTGAERSNGCGNINDNGLTAVESFYHLADLGASSMAIATESSRPSRTDELQEKWQVYRRRLANVFLDIKNGKLENAAEGLLSVSFWLLTIAEELGLTEDDENPYQDGLRLWQDFNHAWIALVFKQKRHLERVDPDNLELQPLSMQTVYRLGDELVSLCDGFERYGLVDYQLGVWEDEIVSLLEDCLTIFEDKEEGLRNLGAETTLAMMENMHTIKE